MEKIRFDIEKPDGVDEFFLMSRPAYFGFLRDILQLKQPFSAPRQRLAALAREFNQQFGEGEGITPHCFGYYLWDYGTYVNGSDYDIREREHTDSWIDVQLPIYEHGRDENTGMFCRHKKNVSAGEIALATADNSRGCFRIKVIGDDLASTSEVALDLSPMYKRPQDEDPSKKRRKINPIIQESNPKTLEYRLNISGKSDYAESREYNIPAEAGRLTTLGPVLLHSPEINFDKKSITDDVRSKVILCLKKKRLAELKAERIINIHDTEAYQRSAQVWISNCSNSTEDHTSWLIWPNINSDRKGQIIGLTLPGFEDYLSKWTQIFEEEARKIIACLFERSIRIHKPSRLFRYRID